MKKKCLFTIILLASLATVCCGAEQINTSDNVTDASLRELVDGYGKSLSWQESLSMRIVADVDSNDNETFPQTLDYIFRWDSDSNRAEWLGKSTRYYKNNESIPPRSQPMSYIADGNMYTNLLGDTMGVLYFNYEERLRGLIENPNYGGPLWGKMYGSNFKSIVDLLNESPDLHMYKDNVNGVDTCVVEGTSQYGKVTVWIAPEKGYTAMKWIIEKEPHHLFNDKTISENRWTTEKWQVSFNVKQLHEIVDESNVVFIPKLAHLRFFIGFNNGETANISHFEYKTSDIQVKPDFETLGAFKIELADGYTVLVQGDSYVWSKEKKFVVNKHDGSIMYVPKDWQLLVNTGEALPDFRDFNVELSQSDTESKMILLCFFDYEQRPSRNCITQLNARAQELKAQGIEVFVIQASMIEQDTLDKWVKGQNISFPVGMIEAEEEQTRFNWGVKSLPWLILTDKNHIITAEGFSINELDEKIEP